MLHRTLVLISSLVWLEFGLYQTGHATTITQTDYGLEWIAVASGLTNTSTKRLGYGEML